MISIDIRSKKDLPRDVDKLQAISWELALAYQKLTEKYNKLLRQMYGKSSEKLADTTELDALQVEMDALLGQVAAVEQQQSQPGEQASVEVTSYKRRRKHPGRNAIPEELITEEIVDIPDSEKACDCGRDKVVIDRKSHVVVKRIPASYKATRFVRLVYACPHCKDGVSVAEPHVLPIAKGLADVELLVFVILSKYLYHLPLYRIQRQIFHESGGIWFTRSTLASWVGQVCGLLERIYSSLLEQYRSHSVKHADESPLQVKCDGHYRQGYMWVGLSGDGRIAVFLYDNHRSGKAACRFLSGSHEGDYLMRDDCPSYNRAIAEYKLIDMRCMVHIRRKFIDAKKAGYHTEYIQKVLVKIGQLYRIERLATKLNLPAQKRGELRLRYSAKIMSQIKTLLENPGFPVLPQNDAGIAINYFLKNWTGACRFLESGDLPIDNSSDERIIRHLAIGRNNWGQAGSPEGAQRMAMLYTLIVTCKLNGIDIHEYFRDVLMRLAIRPPGADISDLTPIGWHKARNNGQMPELKQIYPSKD